MHTQLEQIMDKKIQKDPKPSSHLGAKAGYRTCNLHVTPEEVDKPPEPLLQPDPWSHPFPHPIQGTSSLPITFREQAWEPATCYHSLLLPQEPH